MPDFLTSGDYVIVVAHPDDEVLWFGSLVAGARSIIVCYGDHHPNPLIGPARRKVMERFPYRNVRFLDLEEGGFHNKADWENPSLVPAGMAMRDPLVQGRYDRNFELLVSLFEPLLSDVRAVFTHNPWGEYGHEDHVQVHQATRAIVSRRDTRLMVPAHCARKSLAMMRKTARSVDPHPFSLRVDRQAALAIKHLYEDCGCWTYHKDWMPPEQDVFLTVKYGS